MHQRCEREGERRGWQLLLSRLGEDMTVPVICVDGPGGVGKGTLTLALAKRLGWHLLDSGAIYRALALYAVKQGVDLEDELALASLALMLPLIFREEEGVQIFLEEENVTEQIRREESGANASIIAKHPKVREALLARQRAFAKAPGLVADGRDMGTEIFPNALLKIFLTASSEIRAERRYKQLLQSGNCVKMEAVLSEVKERDARDRSRSASPLIPAEDAIIIDTTDLGVTEVFDRVWAEVQRKRAL